MASYYLKGYTTPDGVNSRADVREWQNKLGVKADGIWGPNTQAAYERYANASSMSKFQEYYDTIFGRAERAEHIGKRAEQGGIEGGYIGLPKAGR